MAANDVTFKISAKNAGFIQTFLQVQDAIDGGSTKMEAFANHGNDAGKKLGDVFTTVGGNIAGSVAQMLGLTSAIGAGVTATRLLVSEFERAKQLRLDTAVELKDVASQRQKMLYSAGMTEQEFAPLQPKMDKLITESGQPHAGEAYETASDVLNSRGDLSPEYAIQMAMAAAKATKRAQDPAMTRSLASSALDLARVLPEHQRNPEDVVGALLNASFKTMRVLKVDSLSQNVVPTLSQIMGARGESWENAVGGIGAMTYQLADAEGRRSSQAYADLMQSINDEMSTHPTLMHDAKFQKQWRQMTPTQQLEWTRSDDRSAKSYRAWLLGPEAEDMETSRMAIAHGWTNGRLHGEQKSMPAMRAMIDPRSTLGTYKLKQKLTSEVAAIGSEDNKKAYRDFSTTGPDSTKTQKFAEAYALQQGANALQESRNVDMAQAGVYLEAVSRSADLFGDTGMSKKLQELSATLKLGRRPQVDQLRNHAEMIDDRVDKMIGDPQADDWVTSRWGERGAYYDWMRKQHPELNPTTPSHLRKHWRDYRLETMGDDERQRIEALYGLKQGLRAIEPSIPADSRADDTFMQRLWRDSKMDGEWERDWKHNRAVHEFREADKALKAGENDQSALKQTMKPMVDAMERLTEALLASQVDHSTVDVAISDHSGRATMRSVYGGSPMERLAG